MSLLGSFWRRICVPLDGFLWHRDISHPIIRKVLRNEILAAGFSVLAGAALFAVWPWGFWFGSGLGCMTWIFWSWARFFLKAPLGEYSAAFLRAILLRFGGRILLTAILLYFALARWHAPASALLCGLAAGAALALVSYAACLNRSCEG